MVEEMQAMAAELVAMEAETDTVLDEPGTPTTTESRKLTLLSRRQKSLPPRRSFAYADIAARSRSDLARRPPVLRDGVTMSNTIEFRVPRTGDTTLTGTGTLLAEINNDPTSNSKRDNKHYRWHNLAVYRTVGGKFILSIGFRTNFIDKEKDNDYGNVFATLPEALFFAREVYDPLKYVYLPVLSAKHMYADRIEDDRAKFLEQYRADCQTLTVQAHAASGIADETTKIE